MHKIARILLFIVFFGAVIVPASGEERESYLLKIDLPKRDAIHDLVELKAQILQEFSKYVIAELEKEYVDNLKRADFSFKILDENPRKNVYYFVLVLYEDDLKILEKFGIILDFEQKTALLKVTAEDVKGLHSHRFMIKKLRRTPVRLKKKSVVAREALAAAAFQANPAITDMVSLVSQGDINDYIQALQDFTTRYSYTTGCENASVYIHNQFDSMGLDVEFHDFGNNMADNVIATQYGVIDPSKIFIICGHYDSTSNDPWNDAPGADDNASGSAAVLEVASILSQYKFNYTIKYICFAGEEQGLFGSEDYASGAAASSDDIAGVLNFDMIAYADVSPEDLDIIGDLDSEWLVDLMVSAAQTYTSLGVVKVIDPSVIYSDHSPFWDEGYSAICGIDDFWPTNPNYHTTQDTINTLSMDFATEVTKLAVAALAELAELFSCGIVLLFDTSGSMSWRHDGEMGVPAEEQRLTLAKEASYPFLEMLNDYNSGKANFGIATFPSHPASSCSAQVITPMTLITETAKNTAISTTIPALTTENNTPLIAGLETAMDMFGWETNKAIVLLSDGYHNCPLHVEAGDAEFNNLVIDLNEKSAKVYTIGFARPGDVDHHFLDELAAETGGEFRDVTSSPGFDPYAWHPATDLQGTYKAILADGLGLETPFDPMGVIVAGEMKTHEIKINENDRKISFFLSWVTPRMGRLKITIITSDGNTLPAVGTGISLHEGKTFRIITLDESFLSQSGKIGPEPWTIEIHSNELGKNEKEYYQCSVIADSRLKMRTELDRVSYKTGDVVKLTARITEGENPVLGLNDVKAIVTRPEEGFGNWFAMNKVTPEELEKISKKRGVENLPPVLRKAIYLTDVRNVKVPGRSGPVSLILYDNGTRGDVIANDGTYTNIFPDTIKEGTYSFYFQSSGSTGKGNTFFREDLVQKYIKVNVEQGNILTDVVYLPPLENKVKRFKVVITPKDMFGNFLGPRYSGMIKLTSSQGTFIGTISDNLDGSYSQNLHLDATVDTEQVDITVNVEGTSVSFNLAEKIKKPYSISFYFGSAIPMGALNKNNDPGLSLGFSPGYYFSHQIWAGVVIGYYNFSSGSPTSRSTYWWSIFANVKYEFSLYPFRLYASCGSGIYIPKKGSTSFGANIGAGFIIPITRSFSIESRYDYHSIFTPGNETHFSQIWTGLMFSF